MHKQGYGMCACASRTRGWTVQMVLLTSLVIQRADGAVWSRSYVRQSPLLAVWGSDAADVFAVGIGGVILHYDGASWSAMTSGTTDWFYGIGGSGPNDVFAVGTEPLSDVFGTLIGKIHHYDGITWSVSYSNPTTQVLYSVWGISPNDAFAVGESGTILHYAGATWSSMTSGTIRPLRGIWASSSSDVFVVGDSGTVVHFDGSSWSTMTSGTTARLYGVWGSSPNDVFAVGESGTIVHYDGSAWSTMASGTTRPLAGISGTGPNDVFAAGGPPTIDTASEGVVLHYDGESWSTMISGTTEALQGIWAGSQTDVFIVGAESISYDGVILHYHEGSVVCCLPMAGIIVLGTFLAMLGLSHRTRPRPIGSESPQHLREQRYADRLSQTASL